MQTCIRTQVLIFCCLGRRKTSDQGCCCIWPVIKTQRNWQFSKTSWPAGEGFGGFAHLTMICFGILLSLIARTSLCYWLCCLQCKEVIAEYSVLAQIWSFTSNCSNFFCYFWTKKLYFQFHLSLRPFLLLWLDPIFSQLTFHFSCWQEQQSVEINFRIWKLILGCSHYFSIKFIIS